MFVRCFSSIRLSNDDGLHVGGVFGTLNSLQSQIRMHSPDIVSVVWEGKGSSERRRKTLKEYKEGGRVKLNEGGYIGPAIKAEYGGVKLSNPYNKKYYKGMV